MHGSSPRGVMEMFQLKRKAGSARPDLAMLQEFLDALGAAVVIIASDHTIHYMNDVARQKWEGGEGERCHRALRGSRDVCADCPLESVIEGRGIAKREMRMLSGGEWHDHENLLFYGSGPEDGIHLVALVSTDIDERRKLEREVLREKGLSGALLESVNAIAIGLDENGRVVLANRAAEEISGYSEEEIKEAGMRLMVPEDSMSIADEYFESISRGGSSAPVLMPIVTRAGGRRMVSWTYSPVAMENGEVEGAIALGQDVTERFTHRKEVEKRARELEVVNAILSHEGASLNPEDFVRFALDSLLALPDYRCGAAYVLERDGSDARLVASSGFRKMRLLDVVKGPERVFPAAAVLKHDITFADPQADMNPHAREMIESEGLRGLAAVPLVSGKHPLGLVLLGHNLEPSGVEAAREMLKAAAEALELGEENEFLRNRAEERAREAGALLGVAQSLAGEIDLEAALRKVVEEAARLLGVDTCSMFLYDEQTGMLQPKAAVGASADAAMRSAIPLSVSGTAMEAAESLKPVAVVDAENDPRVPEFVVKEGVRSSLVVPLSVEGALLGLLFLDMMTARREFTPREMELMEGFARQAATAIHSAALVDRIKESEGRYRALIDNSLFGVFVHDGENITYMNDRAVEISGYPGEELTTVSQLLDTIVPEERDRVIGYIAARFAGEDVPQVYDVNIRRKDGRPAVVQLMNTLVTVGGRQRVMVTVNDITERVAAEEAVRGSEERYRTIVEKSRDVIVLSNRLGEVIYANPQIKDVFGIEPEEAAGRNLFEFVHPDERESVARDFVSDWQTGQPVPNYPIKCVRGDGSIVHVEATSGMVGWPDEDAVQIFVIRDVTERRQREAEREARLKAEEASARIAKSLAGAVDVKSAIAEVLEETGRLIGVDRAYYIEISPAADTFSYAAEWFEDGAEPMGDALNDYPLSGIPWLKEKLLIDGELVFASTGDMPGEAEREIVRRYDIKSIAGVAVMVNGRLAGLIGFGTTHEEREWSTEEVNLLREMATTTSRALERSEWVEELSRSERFRTLITENVGEGLFVLRNGVVTWLNQQAADIYGYEPGEMLGHTMEHVFADPGRIEGFAWEMVEAFEADGRFVTEEKVRRKDGEIRDVLTSAAPLGSGARYGELVMATSDVTESKRMREEAAASAEAYSTLFSTAGDGLAVHTLAGEIKDANERACLYTGCSREELIGRSILEFIPEELRHLYADRQRELEKTGFSGFEMRLLRKDGGSLPVEVSARVTSIWGETVVLSALRDATLRRQAERETRRRAGQLASLNEVVKAATSSLDVDTVVVAILEVAVDVTGADCGLMVLETPRGSGTLKVVAARGCTDRCAEKACEDSFKRAMLEEVRGSAGSAVVGPESMLHGGPGALVAEALRPEGVTQALIVPMKSGEKLLGAVLLGSEKPGAFDPRDTDFYNAAGAEIGVSVENALMYRELADEHERLSLLYRSAQNISGQIDLEALLATTAEEAARAVGGESALLALISPERGEFEWSASYNLDLGQLENTRLPCDRGVGGACVSSKRALVKQRGEPVPSAFRADTVRETLGVEAFVVVPLISGDRAVGVLGVHEPRKGGKVTAEDVLLLEALGRQAGVAIENARLYEETRLHFEALEKAHQELMTLDRMKSDFVATVSHELRSPLAVIGGFAKTLIEHFDQIDEETEKESLEIILKKSIALEGLIENILDMSRIEDGRLEVNLEAVDVVALCERVRVDQDRVAEAHEVALEADGHGMTAVADPEKAEVALGNLVRNAIKFSPEGGRVKISVKESGRMAEISVTDEGVGIPADELEKIFERFYQVDRGETRSFPGSGLGLHITRELVHAMGGTVEVESELEKGSTFTFTLPLAR